VVLWLACAYCIYLPIASSMRAMKLLIELCWSEVELVAVVLLALPVVLLVPPRLSRRLSRDDVESCDGGGGGGGAIPAVADDADVISDAIFDMSVSNSLLLIEPSPFVSRALKS